jgi:hypothetical protein
MAFYFLYSEVPEWIITIILWRGLGIVSTGAVIMVAPGVCTGIPVKAFPRLGLRGHGWWPLWLHISHVGFSCYLAW